MQRARAANGGRGPVDLSFHKTTEKSSRLSELPQSERCLSVKGDQCLSELWIKDKATLKGQESLWPVSLPWPHPVPSSMAVLETAIRISSVEL